jgi:hypothetical protein
MQKPKACGQAKGQPWTSQTAQHQPDTQNRYPDKPQYHTDDNSTE